MIDLFIIAIPVVVISMAVVLYILFPRFGPHYTSKLTCPKCGKTFDYNWVPGGSFTSVRLGKKRYLRCPRCHEWSIYDIKSTRTSKAQSPPPWGQVYLKRSLMMAIRCSWAIHVIVKELDAKTILSESRVLYYTINPYIGCEQGCTYCYARFIRRFTGHKEEWGQFGHVKINASSLLQHEIGKKKVGRVWMSGLGDPYQPMEKEYAMIRRCLEILSKHGWPITIQTKSSLVLRDIDLLSARVTWRRAWGWVNQNATSRTHQESIDFARLVFSLSSAEQSIWRQTWI